MTTIKQNESSLEKIVGHVYPYYDKKILSGALQILDYFVIAGEISTASLKKI